jgi:iron complex outermembrane receptor protein
VSALCFALIFQGEVLFIQTKNYIMKKLLYIFLFLSSFLQAVAQKNISGTVTDKTDNHTLEGISVFIPELQRKTITDASGKFNFENAGEGIVTVQFTGIGYKSQLVTVNPASEQKELTIAMEASATELEEVTVTSNYAKLPDNIPYSANTVSLAEVRKYNSPSVMGNLSYQPGVDRITIGNGIGKPVIRGLSFNRIMLYGQGTRIENQQWDDHHDLGLTDVGIDNIEIVRGPAALIYGADALGGALIFNDEKPAAAGTVEKDFSLGFCSNTLGLNGEFGLKGTGKKGIFYSIRVATNSQTSYLQGEGEEENKSAGGEEEEFAFNSKFMSNIGKVNIGMSKTWGMSKFSYSFLTQQIGIIEIEPDSVVGAGNEEEEQRDREIEAPMQNVTTQIFSLENIFLLGKSKVNVNLAWQINDRKEYEPIPGNKKGELAIGLLLNTATYDVKWTSNAEKSFGITVGSQGTFLTNENKGLEMLVPNADVSDVAGYGLFRYDKGKLNLLGGVRFDARKIEVEGEEEGEMEEDSFIVKSSGDTIERPEADFKKKYSPISFSLGLAYELSKNLKVKLNAATGFSAPNYAELATFGKHEGAFRFERGFSDLNIEQNTEGDLGLIWENEFITLNLGGYINMIKDYIYIENTGDSMIRIRLQGVDTLLIYDYKQNNATISGGEFGFDIHPKTAKWFDFKTTYAVINGELDKGGNLPYIPASKLVSEIKLSKEKMGGLQNPFISFIVSNYGEQTKVAEYELPTEGYTLLDVLLGSSINLGKHKADVQIFCTNFLNEGYFNHLSLIKAIGVKEMGRNIGFRFSMKFVKEKK